MNNKQRKKLQRAVEHRAMKLQRQGFERRIVSTLSSCNQRVEKAVISPSLRDRHESTRNLINMNYQKVSNEAGRQIHAVQKIQGKSIPLI
ncbi:hypothetical protein [Pantoea agglomerans]|uniref:hypothetical protein n=1 Tax=Enterobacter agglomerans TaxID=549 RepID=UPI0015585DA8|nr:hypothetical protein [Pantoea agglomerans]NQS80586.1 hypothetical protein [Pantoea agglomerans]